MSDLTDHTLSLHDLLSGSVHTEIPSFQRAYCWGCAPTQHKREKVTDFVHGVLLFFRKSQPATLGLLLAANSSQKLDTLTVIDGQQRLVTLYLLAGMLFRRTSSPRLRDMLIAPDGKIRLQYKGRREVMYFLTDLVKEFFLNRNGRLSQITGSAWYFSNYDSEPSVMNMLAAIRCIDTVLEEENTAEALDFDALAQFLANDVSFLCCTFPAETDADAIDLYITADTTGEPLTAVQSLKSLALQVCNFSDDAVARWNDMEHRAWLLGRDSNANNADSDDLGESIIKNIFATAALLRNPNAPLLPDKDGIDDVFRISDLYFSLIDKNIFTLDESDFVKLPVVAFARRFGSNSASHIARFAAYLRNKARHLHIDANLIAEAVKMASSLPDPDITSLLRLHNPSPSLVSDEDKTALRILASSGQERSETENAFVRAGAHPMLCGHLQPLIAWCTDRSGNFSLARFSRYTDLLYSTIGTDIDCNPDLDTLRRALLACCHPGFPMLRKGDSVLSLCWRDYDWQRLLQAAPGAIRLLLDRCATSTPEGIIDRFNRRDYPYYFLIKQSNALEGCRRRQLLRPCEPFIGIYNEDTGNVRWYINQRRIPLPRQGWTPLRTYGSRCLYTDCTESLIAIDIYYTPTATAPFRIEIFQRQQGDTTGRRDHRAVQVAAAFIDSLCINARFDNRHQRHFIICPDASAVVKIMNTVKSKFG